MVRLRKGRQSESKIYCQDPANLARSWSSAGIHGIHVVDLDAAFGQGNNLDIISRVVASTHVPVQVGGGVRDPAVARRLIHSGADTVVVGTVALTDSAMFNQISSAAGPQRIVAALDYTGNSILIDGWRRSSRLGLDEALRLLTKAGVQRFLLTSADRDGMMVGPDVETIRSVCDSHGKVDVFASGGVRSVNDIRALREAGAYAVVVGKALLEGTIPIGRAAKEAAG